MDSEDCHSQRQASEWEKGSEQDGQAATPRRWSSRATRAPAAVRAPYRFRAQNLVGAIACGTVRLALPGKRELLRKIFAGFLRPVMLPVFTSVTNLG